MSSVYTPTPPPGLEAANWCVVVGTGGASYCGELASFAVVTLA